MQSTREIDSCIFYDSVYIGVIEKGNKLGKEKRAMLNGTQCSHLVVMSAGDVI